MEIPKMKRDYLTSSTELGPNSTAPDTTGWAIAELWDLQGWAVPCLLTHL